MRPLSYEKKNGFTTGGEAARHLALQTSKWRVSILTFNGVKDIVGGGEGEARGFYTQDASLRGSRRVYFGGINVLEAG